MIYSDLTRNIIAWYLQNSRDLPWRKTRDPYKIWLSEIILQQTRVNQGLPYYNKFIKTFPDIKSLAEVTEDQVLLLWQGLGYYSRARNLHACARKIAYEFDGIFPNTYEKLLTLPGVGEYTAAAIASFAFDISVPAIDGNIIRVMSRLFGIFHIPHSPLSKKMVSDASNQLINKSEPGLYNQAMMEFGALLCTPSNPSCDICHIQKFCWAFLNNKVALLPAPKKKPTFRIRFFYYFIIKSDNEYLIEKRTQQDIWKNLYQFPLIETDEDLPIDEILSKANSLFNQPFSVIKISDFIVHKLSHQIIKARFVHINMEKTGSESVAKEETASYNLHDKPFYVSTIEIDDYAMPRLIRDYLEKSSF